VGQTALKNAFKPTTAVKLSSETGIKKCNDVTLSITKTAGYVV
jgi:hypothetical protein